MKLRKGQSSKRKEDSSKWRQITLSTAPNVPVNIRGLGEGCEGGSPHPLLPDPERGLGKGCEGGSPHPLLPDPERGLGKG